MGYYGLMLIISFTTTAILTLPFSRLAVKNKIVDQPGTHKTHCKAVPLLGGLAIFCGVVVSMFIFSNLNEKMLSILTGALVLIIVGLLDDIYDLKPLVKMAGQTIAAVIVVLVNVDYYQPLIDNLGRFYLPEAVVLILLIGWIVLMINAINLIDGIDGLAAGTATIIFSAMALINLINGGSVNMIALQLMGAGACLGFLLYNYNPARVFMGDTGSMLIGYLLATTFIISVSDQFSFSLVLGSVFIFAYPALDTTFAIVRRIRNGTSIFQADKGHVHHVLIGLGYSVRKTINILYALNICFAAIAVILLSLELSAWLIAAFGLLLSVFFFIAFKYLTSISNVNGLDAIEMVEEEPVIKEMEQGEGQQ